MARPHIQPPADNRMEIDHEAAPERVDGRSRAARAARAAAQEPPDDAMVAPAPQRPAIRRNPRQDAAREPARAPSRAQGTVVGRDGEVLSRKRTSTKDIFDIPEALIPKGWEYQWCAVSVTGNSEILMDQNLMMAENGWRPVPSQRYPGRFMPEGHKGNIVRGGQLLMERPKALCDEARAEDIAVAKRQITDRDQSLMGGKANVRGAMKDGIAMGGRYRGTGADVRMSIDPALDIPMPQHTLAEPGE